MRAPDIALEDHSRLELGKLPPWNCCSPSTMRASFYPYGTLRRPHLHVQPHCDQAQSECLLSTDTTAEPN